MAKQTLKRKKDSGVSGFDEDAWIPRRRKKAVISDSDTDISEQEQVVTGTERHLPTCPRDIKEKTSVTKAKGRRYFVWNEESAQTVKCYFEAYINKDPSDGNKGRLPGKIEIQQFLTDHPDVLPGEPNAINIVKTKVFNERSKRRTLLKKAKQKLGIIH